MDGHVDAMGEQGLLNRLGEHPEPTKNGERAILNLVAVGVDDDEFDGSGVEDRAEPVGDVVGLPEGELAAAGAEAEGVMTGSGYKTSAATRERGASQAAETAA